MTENNGYTIQTDGGKVTLSENELKRLAALGLKMKDREELINRLENTAKVSGITLEKLVDEMCSDRESKIYSQLLEKVSGDEKLADLLYRNMGGGCKNDGVKQNLRCDMSLQAEFDKLKGKYNLSSFERLPQAVKDMAVNDNIPLEYAILRFAADEYLKRIKSEKLRAHNLQMGFVPASQLDSEATGTVLAMLKGVRE